MPRLRVLHFSGSPRAIGEAFGESCRDEIAELYELRLLNALDQARRYGGRSANEQDLLGISRASLLAARGHHEDGYDELCGIARGAGLAPEQAMAMGGLTDFRDTLAWGGDLETGGGCTCFVVQADASADGRVLCGQSWDLGTDNQSFVVGVHRQPTGAPETWCITTVGCLSLMGINEHGLAALTTNLRTRDARVGVPYLNLIHAALSHTDHASALASIAGAQRAAAHSYALVDGSGHAAVLECTATQHRVLTVEHGTHVHCNHCLVPEHAAIEGDTPRRSSEARIERMQELLAGCKSGHDFECLQRHLSDSENGELAICRDDFGGISTNAAILMDPAALAVRACHGPPSNAEWVELVWA